MDNLWHKIIELSKAVKLCLLELSVLLNKISLFIYCKSFGVLPTSIFLRSHRFDNHSVFTLTVYVLLVLGNRCAIEISCYSMLYMTPLSAWRTGIPDTSVSSNVLLYLIESNIRIIVQVFQLCCMHVCFSRYRLAISFVVNWSICAKLSNSFERNQFQYIILTLPNRPTNNSLARAVFEFASSASLTTAACIPIYWAIEWTGIGSESYTRWLHSSMEEQRSRYPKMRVQIPLELTKYYLLIG